MKLSDLKFFKAGLVSRGTFPQRRGTTALLNERPGILDREEAFPDLEQLYEVYRDCNAVRKSVQALRDTILMNGTEWKPKFGQRCKVCGEEYPAKVSKPYCTECGAHTRGDEGLESDPDAQDEATGKQFPRGQDWFEEPNDYQVDALNEFFKSVNRNYHDLMRSLKIFEGHLNIADDAFLLHAADYDLLPDGSIHDWTTREIAPMDPRVFRMVVDPRTMTPGGRWWLCLSCRPAPKTPKLGQGALDRPRAGMDVYEAPPDESTMEASKGVYQTPGECPECGMKLHDVWYVAVEPGASGASGTGAVGDGGGEQVVEYYIGPDPESGYPGEVVHESKFDPNYGYGFAPLVSVFDMAMTLRAMERFMRTFYEEERMPRSALFIPTRNPDGLRPLWESAEDINVSEGGHHVPKFTFDPGETNAVPTYMEFSRLPEEMQFEQVRDEFYRRIGSAFDIAPVLHGNVDAVGLQNQGPTQWQVTLLGAKKGQAVYNEGVFPKLLELVRLKCTCYDNESGRSKDPECKRCGGDGRIQASDWRLQLAPVELEDDLQRIQRDMMLAQHAMTMQQLGYPPESRDPETGEFEFPVEPQQPDPMEAMMGGLGGMMGGGGGGMPGGGMGGMPGGGGIGGGGPTMQPPSSRGGSQ